MMSERAVRVIRPGNVWADVNDIMTLFVALQDQPLLPPLFVPMIALHRIDGPALLELTNDDLYDTFRITKQASRDFILSVIEEQRRLVYGSAEPEATQPAEAAECGFPSTPAEATPVQPCVAAADGDVVRIKDDDDDDEDFALPRMEEFTFVENALRKFDSDERFGADAAVSTRIQLRRQQQRSVLRTYAARPFSGRQMLAPNAGV
jgi:hypothetical protein